MQNSPPSVPFRAWVVTYAGMAVNLCLGILYAWSIWKGKLVATPGHEAGSAMDGLNTGWSYLTDAQATWAYSIGGMTFALCMIPGGIVQDRLGPKVGATAGGLFLVAGCMVAGLLKSYLGLVIGFGLLGGIGMGLGYAAATPAAVKWFGPHRRGLVVGIVVGGFGAAAIYVSPLAQALIDAYGITGSFVGLGSLFAVVIIVAGQLLAWPPTGYVTPPPAVQASARQAASMTARDWKAKEMASTWQFYALVALFFGQAQSGLLVIANAKPLLSQLSSGGGFFQENAWLLPAYVGLINAIGRVGTGFYSDKLGRINAYLLNGGVSAVCLLALPAIIQAEGSLALFAAVGVVAWQYGGCLSLMPAITADFFGPKNLGFNYGLVFLGWGLAFLIPLAAGFIKDATGSLDVAFYGSGGLLAVLVLASKFVRRPGSSSLEGARRP